ncbi:nucleoside triphosphate pyrophosphohydrolase [Candidatus Peregrinibacteria bacterium]|nr:nucleoside triphosphate pyrophosphohydrolase [Candidatus Peregrinibacteria bacterium]
MKIYNKLVRDRIPEIIEAEGKKATVRVLDEVEYRKALLEKLVEEAQEAHVTRGDSNELAKEIGDVLEVVDALVSAFGLDRNGIEELKKNRREKRGGFKKKLFLESAEE